MAIMIQPPLVCVGQIYLHSDLNAYLIVTRNNRGQIHFAGDGFFGQAEDEEFVSRYGPVDPDDVDADEIAGLLTLCPEGTQASTGFVPHYHEAEVNSVCSRL